MTETKYLGRCLFCKCACIKMIDASTEEIVVLNVMYEGRSWTMYWNNIGLKFICNRCADQLRETLGLNDVCSQRDGFETG